MLGAQYRELGVPPGLEEDLLVSPGGWPFSASFTGCAALMMALCMQLWILLADKCEEVAGGGLSGVVDLGEYICSSGWHGGCNILCCSPPALCHQLSCRDVGADYRAGLGFLWYWVEEPDTITFYFCWFLNWVESLSSGRPLVEFRSFHPSYYNLVLGN